MADIISRPLDMISGVIAKNLPRRFKDVAGNGTEYAEGVAVTSFAPGGVANGPASPLAIAERYFAAASPSFTRPNDTTAYAVGDLVANNTAAASVVALQPVPAVANDQPISIVRATLVTSGTAPGTASASFRAWLYNQNPAGGIANGDNGAFSVNKAGFIGTMQGVFRLHRDGSTAILVPDEGPYMIAPPVAGGRTIYVLLQTLTVFTPAALSTFAITLEGVQGNA
jgi:hypothetical protein